MEQHIDLKTTFAYFKIKEYFDDFDNATISSIKLYPTSIIENYISINEETFKLVFKEYDYLVDWINNSAKAHTANAYFCLLKVYNPKIDLKSIIKSKSIRSFLQHFKINDKKLEVIVKAFSNRKNEDEENQKDIAKTFDNYFKKNNINFNQFIVKNKRKKI